MKHQNGSDEQLRQLVLDEVTRPFDLTSGPLLRLAVFRVSDDDAVVVATAHHIVVDFWSLILLLDEIRSLYPRFCSEDRPALPDAPANYHRFVSSQRELLQSERGKELAEYWKHQIVDTRPIIDWVTDFERPRHFSHRAGVHALSFPNGFGRKVMTLANELGVTANVVLLAALQVVIGRFTNQDSFAIGTPFSGRSQSEFEKTVGFFVNMLPITADLSQSPSFAHLVHAAGKQMIGALAGESWPFSEIVRQGGVARDPSRHPLFQVSCTFEKSQLKSEEGRASFLLGDGRAFDDFAGMRQESFHVGVPTCLYDVEFVFEFDGDELRGMICYCRDLFAHDTIESLAQQFVSLCDRLIDGPDALVDEVPWEIPFADKGSNETTIPGKPDTDSTLIEMLDRSSHPIVRQAKRFATCLVRSGVEPSSFVPVCLPRGPDAWVGIFGVMLAGAVPIPIDADQPAVAPQVLKEDAEIRFVVARRECRWASEFEASILTLGDVVEADAPTTVKRHPDDLAYVIYTSGSTGKPKGVMVQQAAIANTLRWQIAATPFSKRDRVLILLSHQFDAALAVAATTVLQDAELIWPDQLDHFDLDGLVDQILRDGITVLPAVSSFMRVLAEHPRFAECQTVRQIWTGAEAVPESLPPLIRSKLDCEIWNYYGPTEAAIEVAAQRIDQIDPLRRMPIGREIDGIRIDIVDERLAPVPVGVPGQIVISGRGLALGYLNRPELTEEVFVESPHLRDADGKPLRIYLTGDLGRRRGDGTLEFVSRMDHQVKLRGYRIELQEIERTIESYAEVDRAAVKVIGTGTAGERLAAFVSGTQQLDVESLRRFLTHKLPEYKRPTSVTILDELPLGTSGKVERGRLPDPTESGYASAQDLPPRTDLERFLVERFSRALEVPSVGIQTNFFEAGGTSLQAAILTSELSREMGIEIPTSLLFDLGDVASFSSRLVQLHESDLRNRFGEQSILAAQLDAEDTRGDSLLIQMNAEAAKDQDDAARPIFMIHPPGGITLCYREIAKYLDARRPLVAVRSRGLYGAEPLPESITEMAADYAASITRYQPRGPYLIGGWSLGGVMAFEVACQLIRRGEHVFGLVLLDSTLPEESDQDGQVAGQEYGVDLSLSQLGQLSDDEQLPFLYEHARRLGVLVEDSPSEVTRKVIEDLRRLFAHHVQLCQSYRLSQIDVPVLLLRPREVPVKPDPRPDRGWGRFVDTVVVQTVAGHHHSMVQTEGAREIAEHIIGFAKEDAKEIAKS